MKRRQNRQVANVYKREAERGIPEYKTRAKLKAFGELDVWCDFFVDDSDCVCVCVCVFFFWGFLG